LWVSWKTNEWFSRDPGYCELRRRPHPLPGAEWLEERDPDGTVLALDVDCGAGAGGAEWLRGVLPPGAERAEIPVEGKARLWVNGAEAPFDGQTAELPNPRAIGRIAVLRVEPSRGKNRGALLRGPVTYFVGTGTMALGDWTKQGLETYSGGVRYAADVELEQLPDKPVLLDLGEVRGTAEVRVNGRDAGVRIWSPYRLDVTPHLRAGTNRIEVTVFNPFANYLHGASLTHYIGKSQLRSGLFGPVRLLVKR